MDTFNFKSYFFPLIFMLVAGWGGLVYLLTQTQPYVWQRWAFFVLLFMASTASAFPFVFLWHRWRQTPDAEQALVRQSLWVGAYAVLYAWLEMMFTVSLGLAAGLALIFLGLESAIRLIERARWTPGGGQPHA